MKPNKFIQKTMALVLSVIMALALTPMPSAASGDGTELTPFVITTEAGLNEVRTGLSAHYILDNDITLTGGWTAISNFAGVFDGNGKTISGVTITGSPKNLFGSNSGTIKNLSVVYNTRASFVSRANGIAATNTGTIDNCNASLKFNPGATYTTISSVPTSTILTSQVLIDLTSHATTAFNKTITLGTAVEAVKFVSLVSRSYTGLNIIVTGDTELIFDNFRFTGDASAPAITFQNVGRYPAIISTGSGKTNSITGLGAYADSGGNRAVIEGAGNLCIVDDANLTISHDNSSGAAGASGKSAIRISNNLYLDIAYGTEITIRGGDGKIGTTGSSGSSGSTGAKGYDRDSDAPGDRGGDGGIGETGSSGGKGGNGGDGIVADGLSLLGSSVVKVYGGSGGTGGGGGTGGRGGTGGNGGRGGNGNVTNVAGKGGDGGAGGRGGAGGTGGAGGDGGTPLTLALTMSPKPVYSELCYLVIESGKAGPGGSGGNGGAGGQGGIGGPGGKRLINQQGAVGGVGGNGGVAGAGGKGGAGGYHGLLDVTGGINQIKGQNYGAVGGVRGAPGSSGSGGLGGYHGSSGVRNISGSTGSSGDYGTAGTSRDQIPDSLLIYSKLPNNTPVMAPITGVVTPIAGAVPSTSINNGKGFTASMYWNPNPDIFALTVDYSAVITLTAESGYSFATGFETTEKIAGFTVNEVAPALWSVSAAKLMFTVTFKALPEVTVNIEQTDTVAQIKAKFDTQINYYSGGGIINVTGSKNNADSAISLTISENITIRWKAAYGGTGHATNGLLSFAGTATTGKGKFELLDGGSFTATGTSRAICTAYAPITISGGTISSANATAIYSTYAPVTVNGGKISVLPTSGGDYYAIYTTYTGANVTMNGGAISTNINAKGAIYSAGTNNTVVINGGEIFYPNASNRAIHAAGTGTIVTVKGGVVFSYGTKVSDVVYAVSTFTSAVGTGVIIACNYTAGKIYANGSYEDIVKSPATATAVWSKSSGASGISYQNGVNTGFISVDGITVQSSIVEISQSRTVADIVAEIGVSLGLYDDITVIGSKTGVTETLSLNIPTGKKVVWKAEYEAAEANISTITLTGIGEFEVAQGGMVSSTGLYSSTIYTNTANASVTVSGGMISAKHTAISVGGGSTATVSGGTVSAVYVAISVGGGSTVTVSGGLVNSETYAVSTAVGGENATVTVSGGTVSGNLDAIYSTSKGITVTVSGGAVISKGTGINNAAIRTSNDANNTVTVSGGLVIGYKADSVIDMGTNTEGFTGPTGTGIVLSWDKTAGRLNYLQNTSLDISARPAGATAIWGADGGKNGIVYENGTNVGFIEIEDIKFINHENIDSTVEITNEMSPDDIKEAINKSLLVYDAVTVTESKTNVAGPLSLSIMPGKKVVWKAEYEMSANFYTPLITLTNSGEFEVAQGGTLKSIGNNVNHYTISVTGTGGKVTVSGGTVTSDNNDNIYVPGTNAAITVSDGTVKNITVAPTGSGNTVTVSGGTVRSRLSSYGAINIYGTGNTVTVSGGTVMPETSYAIYISGTGNKVTVSGGTVMSETSHTIYSTAANATVGVSGGTVISKNNYPIYLTGANSAVTVSGGAVISKYNYAISTTGTGGEVTVSGGFVFCYALSANNVIYINGGSFTGPTGTGVISAWNKDAGRKNYLQDSNADISVRPAGKNVKWSVIDDKNGIFYENGTTSGFIEIEGITFVSGEGIENTITITNDMTSAEISAAITESLLVHDTVTVTGSKTNATEQISLGIPEGRKVVWNAQLKAEGTVSRLIYLTANGEFEVAQGGTLEQSGSNYCIDSANTASVKITVSGGTLSTSHYYSIRANGSHNSITVNGGTVNGGISTNGLNSSITVNGGTVSGSLSTNGSNSSITVSGGTVNGMLFISSGSNSSITVSGGSVLSVSNYAIYINSLATNNTITISGGLVIAKYHAAISDDSANATITISGGVVFAFSNTDVNNIMPSHAFSGLTGTGVVIAWSKEGSSYTAGTSTNLTYKPNPGAKVYWVNNNGVGSIYYENGTNSGFIAVDGVTVNEVPYNVVFTAEQVGGASCTADSTGIKLMFTSEVEGLTIGDITITNGTGEVVTGALFGSGTEWTVELSGVAEEGDVTVSVRDFGDFTVMNSQGKQTVAVYKMDDLNYSADYTPENGVVEYNAPAGAAVVVAFYKSNKLLSMDRRTVIKKGLGEFNDVTVDQDADTIKVMIWKSIDDMLPLCIPKDLKYEDGVWN